MIRIIPSFQCLMAACVFMISSVMMPMVTTADDSPASIPAGETDQGQGAPQIDSGGSVPGRDAPIEEITVIGQRLILTLRQQIIESEDYAYDLFNKLNDDDQFDIHCRMVALTGTLIRRRMCLPNFYHRATADNAAEYLNLVAPGNFPAAVSPSAKNVTAAKFPVLKNKVRELAQENPDLLYALRDLSELADELNQVRNTYHGLDAGQEGE